MKRHTLPILSIIVVSIVLYANTLKNGFVYDDNYTVASNTLIKDIANLPKLFVKEDYFVLSGERSYRPVVTFTYFADYAIYGLKPWGYHLTNLLLHGINGVLLYTFLTLITQLSAVNVRQSRLEPILVNKPFVISLLFASHPVLTEAVNGISFREDLLTSVFYLATLNLYLFFRSKLPQQWTNTAPIYLLSCLTYSLALFSKEMALTLPLIIYCYEWIYNNKGGLRKVLLNPYNTGYICISFIYVSLRFFYFYNIQEIKFPIRPIVEFIKPILLLLSHYFKIELFPISLSADYVFDIEEFSFSSVIVSSIVIGFFLATAFIMKKKNNLIAFGILFFIISLAPVYNIVPIDPFAERYLYLPTIGFAIAAGTALRSLFKPRLHRESNSLYLTIIFILCIYSLIVFKRNGIWNNDYSLWLDTVKKMPFSSRAYDGLGIAAVDKKEFANAIIFHQTAIRLNPYNPIYHNNLGIAYARQNRFEEAIKEFKIALTLKPSYSTATRNLSTAHYDLGNIYTDEGKLDAAIVEYEEALRLKPDYPDAHYNLGTVYAHSKRFNEAIKEFQAVLALKPDFIEAHYNLGTAYLKKGLTDNARMEFESVLQQRPDFLPAALALIKIKGG